MGVLQLPTDGSSVWAGISDLELITSDGCHRVRPPYDGEPPHGDSCHRIETDGVSAPGYAWGCHLACTPNSRSLAVSWMEKCIERKTVVFDLEGRQYSMLPFYISDFCFRWPHLDGTGPAPEQHFYTFNGTENWLAHQFLYVRIATLSDIHGDPAALDAVLEDIQTQGADLIVNLGDIASSPFQPRETVNQLMAPNLPTICDDHERQALVDDPSRMGASDQYAFEQSRPDQFAWFTSLPVLRYIDGDALLIHGSAQGDQAYFLESLSKNGCRAAVYDEVLYRTEDTDAKLVLCGHTHIPHAMKLTDGHFTVNPGNVGLQACNDVYSLAHAIETGSPHARYAAVAEHTGEWTAEFRAVECARNDTAAIAER